MNIIKRILNRVRQKKVAMDFRTGMELTSLPVITFYQNGTKLTFLLDTGSNHNIINRTATASLVYSNTEMRSEVYGIDGVKTVSEVYDICLEYRGFNCSGKFIVCDMDKAFRNMKDDTGVTIHGILGTEFFVANRGILDFKELKAYFEK